MKTQHTEGKWQFKIEDGYDHIVTDNTTVARIYQRMFRKETISNAKLIASAPELLEALKSAVWTLKNSGLSDEAIRNIVPQSEMLIKKATQ